MMLSALTSIEVEGAEWVGKLSLFELKQLGRLEKAGGFAVHLGTFGERWLADRGLIEQVRGTGKIDGEFRRDFWYASRITRAGLNVLKWERERWKAAHTLEERAT